MSLAMTPAYASVLARYNRWMNDKLYAVSASLTNEERTLDRGAFFGSVHRTFNHLLVADRIWLARLEATPLEGDELAPGGIRALDQELCADFDELRRERTHTDEAITAFVATLTDARIQGDLHYVRRGAVNTFPTWHALAQMFNHQTHHRGQLTTLLLQAGQDPGVTDLVAMLRE